MRNSNRNDSNTTLEQQKMQQEKNALSEYYRHLKEIDGDIDDMIFFGEDPKDFSEK